MGRLDTVPVNKTYKLVDNADFMQRLQFKKVDDLPTKIDCIKFATQYLALYEAMERRLSQLINVDTLYLGLFNKEPWVDRSEQLKNDLREMKSFLSDKEKEILINDNHLYPALQQMIARIANCDPVSLFAFFSMRSFIDSSTGSDLAAYIQRVFGDKKLKGEFFGEIADQINPLIAFVNNAVLPESVEKQFERDQDDFLQFHIDLFEQMETARNLPEKIVSQPSCYKIGCRYAMFAISAMGLAAVAGSAYYNLTSPQK